MKVAGVILAGGKARRMGKTAQGDKALITLGGVRLIDRIAHRAAAQTDELIINARGDKNRFAPLQLKVVPDILGEGPLAGIHAGMNFYQAKNYDFMASFAVDTPFFPQDFVAQCWAHASSYDSILAHSSGRLHPVFGLWRIALKDDLTRAIKNGTRKITDWTQTHRCHVVEFKSSPFDPFTNINDPAQLQEMEDYLSSAGNSS